MQNQENVLKILQDTYDKILFDDPSDAEGKKFVKDLLAQIKKAIDNPTEENLKEAMEMMHIYSTTMLSVAHANDAIAIEATEMMDQASEQIDKSKEIIDKALNKKSQQEQPQIQQPTQPHITQPTM